MITKTLEFIHLNPKWRECSDREFFADGNTEKPYMIIVVRWFLLNKILIWKKRVIVDKSALQRISVVL